MIEAGEELIESYSITHMAHGTPLATGDAEFECGASGPFLLEVGISSSFHIAKFFGLTQAGARATSSIRTEAAVPATAAHKSFGRRRAQVLHGEILTDDEEIPARARAASPRIDIGAVINKALEAAGLLRR